MPSMAEAGDLPSRDGGPARGRTPSPRRFPTPAGSLDAASSACTPRTPGRPDPSERRRPEDHPPERRPPERRPPEVLSPPFAGRSASMRPPCSTTHRFPRSQPPFCAARLNFPASQKCVFAAASWNPLGSGYPLFGRPVGRRESRRAQPSERFHEGAWAPARSGGRVRGVAWLRSEAASADTPSVTEARAASPRITGASGDPCEGAERNFYPAPDNVEWGRAFSPRRGGARRTPAADCKEWVAAD